VTSIILAAATHYTEEQVRPFAVSLARTGYAGELVLLGDGSANWPCFKGLRVKWLPFIVPADFHVGNVRFREYWIYLRDLPQMPDQVIVCDLRDLIWQTDPAKNMPATGLHSFEECRLMTIGDCPYNGPAVTGYFGPEMLTRLHTKPIICSGTIAGGGAEVATYCFRLWDRIFKGPRKGHNLMLTDQAQHEVGFYTAEPNCTIWENEKGPVYTVGYLPRESLTPDANGLLHNEAGIPCVIHQWDRHSNLSVAFKERYK
jgi:hypothetical protein